jgi:hypothetical protein
MNKETLLPLRIPTGWSVGWNGLFVTYDEDGKIVDHNDSEDILWLRNERFKWDIDVGWYHYSKKFRVVFLTDEHGWDSPRKNSDGTTYFGQAMFDTADINEVVQKVEEWLMSPPVSGGYR